MQKTIAPGTKGDAGVSLKENRTQEQQATAHNADHPAIIKGIKISSQIRSRKTPAIEFGFVFCGFG